MIPDNRGSKNQLYLYNLCIQLYPQNKIGWEVYIPDTNQRFDIFLFDYGIAIEFNGRQHTEFVEHFHKDGFGYIDSVKKDNLKQRWADDNGIVIVWFDEDNLPKDHLELKSIINKSIKDTDYTASVFDKPKDDILAQAKIYRKQSYLKSKNKK